MPFILFAAAVAALGLCCCMRAFSSCSPWVIPTVVTVSFDGWLVNSSRKPSWVCKGRNHTFSVSSTPGKAERGCEYPARSCNTQRRHQSWGILQGRSREQGVSASKRGDKASGSLAVLVEYLSPKSVSKDWRGCCYFKCENSNIRHKEHEKSRNIAPPILFQYDWLQRHGNLQFNQ